MLRDDRGPRPGDRVRRQLARLPPLRGAQQRRPRAVPELHQRAAPGDVRGAGPLLHRRRAATTARSSTSSTPNHTFVNPVLARHYGMPEPERPGRTSGSGSTTRDRYGRGGLLPMAVFLTKNSPGLRTSPVKRGYWVVRRLLGENIPPPPPTVPELPERRGQARRADAAARRSPGTARTRAAPAATSGSTRSAWPSRATARSASAARSTSAAGRSTPRATFPDGGEGTGSTGLRAYLARAPRRTISSTTCAASCSPTPSAAACCPRTTSSIEAMRAPARGRRLPLRRPGRERSSPAPSS